MSILYKYFSKEIIKQFGLVLVTVISIYVVVDFFEKSDNFARAGLPFSKILIFFLLRTPLIFAQITPVGILLSVIIIFSLMNKNNEILALQISGVSPQRLLTPVIVIGASVSIFLFFFSDIIVPAATIEANRMWFKEVKKRSLVTSEKKNIWIKDDYKITHIKYCNPKDNTIFGIAVSYFDKDFKLIRKIDAEKGAFLDNTWVLENALEQKISPAVGGATVSFHDTLKVYFDFMPNDLKRVIKKPSEMSYKELADYIRKVEDDGYDATKYRVDLHAKPAYAFACVVMCIIGMGLSIRKHRLRSIFINIFYGILIAFLYWIFYSFCLSLGYGEILPPFIAAWITNTVFLCLGILILTNLES